MNNKLFIGNLNYEVTEAELKEALEQHAEVVSVKIIIDRETNRSKGFAFVEFNNAEDAAKIKDELNEAEFAGRTIYIDFAKEKKEG